MEQEILIILSRWQFALTAICHFFFVPLTIGMSFSIAIMETLHVMTGKSIFRRMARFWGRLFLINFAVGVVTGLVMEFQFGMNWSEFSKFVGDVFGVPLAIEVMTAFFMESVFIGIWAFSWDRFSPLAHCIAIWLVAIASTASALWILIANAFMQEPAGFVIRNGRAELVDFSALFTNVQFLLEFWHTWFAALCTAGFFMLAVCAFHIWRKSEDQDLFRLSFKFATLTGFAGVLLVILAGHAMADHIVVKQPMKLAAMEALWNSEDPAGEGVIVITDQKNMRNVMIWRIPYLLDLLAYGKLSGDVRGIKELQDKYVKEYGPGYYVPPVWLMFYSFRVMVGAGMAMIGITLLTGFWSVFRGKFNYHPLILFGFMASAGLPYAANTTGWIVTEVGRQPWIVHGIMKTSAGVSSNLTWIDLALTLLGFGAMYGFLMLVDAYLLGKYAMAGSADLLKAEMVTEPEKQD